jgi:tetratricopeptide (TPR) repeat protein
MQAKKNRMPTRLGLGLVLALLLAGCMPAGPRAVLKGKKLLDAGDYPGAVESLRVATAQLPNNPQAWNYLGVACQKAQQPDDAAAAYQRALYLDHNLVEAHWNLGMLYLEQNKNDLAQQEFTAYTFLRNTTPEGWLKLGAAELRLGEIASAERSFGAVRVLDPYNAEALNGLGLARLERQNPREAVQFFAAAIKAHPDCAAAILNLAVTAQQYLHDDRLALQYYQSYLTLTPRPDNSDDVSALVNGLQQEFTVAAIPTPVPPTPSQVPLPTTSQTPSFAWATQSASPDVTPRRTAPSATSPAPVPRPVAVVRTNPTPPPARATTTTVVVPPAPPIVTYTADHPLVEPPPPGATPAKTDGFWSKISPSHWFESPPPDKKYINSGVTSLPSPADEDNQRTAVPTGPASFPRYGYLAPARPQPGDRRSASGAFNQARIAEQASRWLDAMQAYRAAAELDPGWFEAEYNFGVLSYRLGNHRQALAAYEQALAIQPDSVDARYNFALALKAAGYVTDAINELKKVLAANPNEVRVHLALANLYAQKLHDPNLARDEYLKVLDLDPNNAQAADIRYWLSLNSQ